MILNALICYRSIEIASLSNVPFSKSSELLKIMMFYARPIVYTVA